MRAFWLAVLATAAGCSGSLPPDTGEQTTTPAGASGRFGATGGEDGGQPVVATGGASAEGVGGGAGQIATGGTSATGGEPGMGGAPAQPECVPPDYRYCYTGVGPDRCQGVQGCYEGLWTVCDCSKQMPTGGTTGVGGMAAGGQSSGGSPTGGSSAAAGGISLAMGGAGPRGGSPAGGISGTSGASAGGSATGGQLPATGGSSGGSPTGGRASGGTGATTANTCRAVQLSTGLWRVYFPENAVDPYPEIGSTTEDARSICRVAGGSWVRWTMADGSSGGLSPV